MNSIVGRPHALTDAQAADILAWHASRKTIRDVANEYGVSRAIIDELVRRRGQYKQASPELRPIALAAMDQRRAELEACALN